MLRSSKGFLLVDALIAVMIVSVMSLLVSGSIASHIRTEDYLKEKSKMIEEETERRYAELQECAEGCGYAEEEPS